MPINGETFEYYKIQQRVKEIKKCINILKSHGYTIVDLEGKIIEKDIK
jgi:hypothetical protein